jgi:hypothetical protein
MCSRLQIVAFAPLYCRFIAALRPNSARIYTFGAEPLSLSDRICRIPQSGGVQ